MADRNFERALRSAARRGRTAGVCPDAATLAAYVDRSLSAQEHTAIEAHVSDCAVCIEHLALLAALDAPEDSTIAAPAFDVGTFIRKWGWLVPAMTAVLVVAVWLRSPDQRRADGSLPTLTRNGDQAPVAAPRAPVERRPDAARVDPGAPPSGASKLQAKRDMPAEKRRKIDAPARRASPAAKLPDTARPSSSPPPPPSSEAASPAMSQQADRDVGDEKNKEAGQAAGFVAAAPPPTAATSSAREAEAREGALTRVAPAPMIGGASADTRMRKVARQESATTASSVRVRTALGRIDRSTDGGQSWTNEHDGLTDRIRITLCPTATACWLGEDNGAVFVRSTDGQWVRRVVPAPAAAVERIVALDNQHATVELSDGRRYVTADGGLTWTAARAQP
jgi:Putative zinc-finger